MTWLTWRQFRAQAWPALAAMAALAAVLAVTGPILAELHRSSGLLTCQSNCAAVAESFLGEARTGMTGALYWLGNGVVFAAPALIGVFWGAPLVARELEAGTHRMVWNQGVTRTRWLAVKLLGVGSTGVATAGLLSLAVTWWAAPIDAAGMTRILPEVFAARGVAPVGYAAFAFAVGVTAGTLVRRVVPAMAMTLLVVVAAQVVMPLWVREHLVAPVHATAPLDTSGPIRLTGNRDSLSVTGQVDQPGAWVVSNQTITASGQEFTAPGDSACAPTLASTERCADWLDGQSLQQQVAYQPGSRFWTLQWYETAIFLGLAAILVVVCFRWIRPRRT